MPVQNALTTTDFESLVQIASELTSQIDLSELLHLVLRKSGELSDSPDGAIILHDENRNTLYFAGAIGQNASMLLETFGEFAKQQVPVEGSKAGSVFQSGESIIIDNIAEDQNHFKGVDRETREITQSMVCVPLAVDGKCIGVMQLLNKRSGNYTKRDQILLEQFAIYAAVALRNARVFEDLIAHMGLYSSPEFSGGAAELLNQLKSPARVEKLTVLFADMRGFRLLCQIINNPERILQISSQFITMLSDQVLQHGGIVNKFLGDGILALFRKEEHAQRAVTCAFKMVERFAWLKSKWDQESVAQLDFLDIGLGITTDEVIIGTIGNSKIHDFTAIGNAVNLAAAFEKEARGGKRILVDQFTYLAVKDMVSNIEGPYNYELKQPDQRIGNLYKQYHLKQLTPIKESMVFISHSEADRKFVEDELIPFLDKNGIKHWYSRESITVGESWVASINKGLEICNWVIVLISKASLDSGWVKEEIDMAAARRHLRDKIIPLRLDDTKPEEVNLFLSHKQSIDANNTERYLPELITLFK